MAKGSQNQSDLPLLASSNTRMKFLRHRAQQSTFTKGNKRASDDEGSVSSTITAQEQSKHLLVPPRPSRGTSDTTNKLTAVRFNLSKNVELASAPITEEGLQSLWYSQDDYKQFKRSFNSLAKEFHKYDEDNSDPQSFGYLLSRSFDACCEATEDYRSCLLGAHEEEILSLWFEKCSRRGLERVSVPKIFADKSARRNEVSDTVLDVQSDTCHMANADERAELIRQASEEVSRASRIFAWRLAG